MYVYRGTGWVDYYAIVTLAKNYTSVFPHENVRVFKSIKTRMVIL